MERIHRLIEVWSRLPAFRVVAETEHLPTASSKLGITPPALSRSVKLIEESVGRELFHRRGRRIELNGAGRVFLQAVRTAMRQVDGALETLIASDLAGRVTVSSTGMFTPLAVKALLDLVEAHPQLRPHLTHLLDTHVNRALLRGELDVALLQHPTPHPELAVVPLAHCPYGVYCGAGHPLAEREHVTVEDVLAHPFVAPPVTDGPSLDGWPAQLERTVAMTIVQVEVAVRVVAEGRLLSVLPVPIVASSSAALGLRRLPVDLIAPTVLHAVHRRPVGPDGQRDVAERVVDAVRMRLDDAHLPALGEAPGH